MSPVTRARGGADDRRRQDFDLQYPRVIEGIKADVGLGRLLGVRQTPTFFINGVKLEGADAADARPGHRVRAEEGGQSSSSSHAVHAIDTENLTKDYALGFWRKRPYRALDRLTLEVEPGEVFGLLGPERRRQDDDAEAAAAAGLSDRRPRRDPRPARRATSSVRRRIGYLPENPYFYDHLTAVELLDYFGRLLGLGAADRAARMPRLLDQVGLGAERRLPLRRYSKGMLQRVGLAQALLNEPEVVFLDEPMSGLDPIGRRMVRELILGLRDRGATVFFSSHILSDAEAVCSRVAILAGGRLVASGRLTDLLAFGVKGWEVVVEGADAGGARPRAGARRPG